MAKRAAVGGDQMDLALQVHTWLPVIILAIGLAFTPIYIYNLARQSPGAPWKTHAAMATAAFLVWAYSIQGSAFTIGHGAALYDGSYASALVILFTLVSGSFAPKPLGSISADGRPI